MRAVALSDQAVQDKVSKDFIPLKVVIKPGTEEFPLDWPALEGWAGAYQKMGGASCEGFTCCTTVSPDLQAEYGNTGSAFVWEMFDSIAYDADKFAAMLERSAERFKAERSIKSDPQLGEEERAVELSELREQVRRKVAQEGRFRLPPRGFSAGHAIELFRLSGDLPPKE